MDIYKEMRHKGLTKGKGHTGSRGRERPKSVYTPKSI